MVNASAQGGIYLGSLRKVEITITLDNEEQEAIAKTLTSEVEMIDSLITEKEKLLVNLESYKRSLIYETVTGKRKVV